ncbi:putative NEK kinase [Neospora caninum Liverpool]|uniref:non-specific serine/threonine protein kinase n=1 Tax=Neospora caninum (strain Liverpool) TaxID=572307 RepID=F0VB36_NEOCL|nr:putative NEK kinase [Neospora caninum Liverpool]CBZ50858.1 putative NEK kinase [Neospora caninum Liverpool]CEL68160.1 TPA: NEK kinase, putative [Neospora caninum Liverpool]|eukprot:XP_003880891.1 putative NEK kinase [Neospora caninum Liverpool]
MERYKKIKRLGAGAQGDCYLVRDKKTGKLYVRKDIKLSLLETKQRQEALKESTILRDVSTHPNVITYFNYQVDKRTQILHTLIEYADGGDLEQQIQLRRNLLDEQLEAGRTENDSSPPGTNDENRSPYAPLFFKEEHVLLVFVQALAGLYHLHSRGILHRDVKSQNIFLSSAGLIKLGDFGIARQLNKENMAETYVGSPCYMSPELYKREPYNYKSDIWALGCVLFELCCLRKPFQGSNIVVLAMQVTQSKPPSHLDTPPGLYPPPLHHLVNRMLQVDPVERPSAAEIMATPYILKSMKKLIKRYPQLHYLQSYLNDLSPSVARELPPSNPPYHGSVDSGPNAASGGVVITARELPQADNREDAVYRSDEPRRPSCIKLEELLNNELIASDT